MNERGCPPDYNGGFCADYDVDCKACWEQWEQEHKAEERCVMDECKVCANADNEYCFACDNGNQFKPITNADSCIVRTIKLDSSPIAVVGTTCQICDGFIPVYDYRRVYPRICDECKKRLKKLLYGESEDE